MVDAVIIKDYTGDRGIAGNRLTLKLNNGKTIDADLGVYRELKVYDVVRWGNRYFVHVGENVCQEVNAIAALPIEGGNCDLKDFVYATSVESIIEEYRGRNHGFEAKTAQV